MFKYESMPKIIPLKNPLESANVFRIIWYWITFIRRWELIEDWYYEYKGVQYVIPKGFQFNGVSVPRTYWWVLSPVGVLFIPSIVHDYMYRRGCVTLADTRENIPIIRKEADLAFRNISNEINKLSPVNTVAYYFVRWTAWVPWNRFRRKD